MIGQLQSICRSIDEAIFLVRAKIYEEPIPKIVIKISMPKVPDISSFHQKTAIGTWTIAQTKLVTKFAFHSSPNACQTLLKIKPLKVISSVIPVASDRKSAV